MSQDHPDPRVRELLEKMLGSTTALWRQRMGTCVMSSKSNNLLSSKLSR